MLKLVSTQDPRILFCQAAFYLHDLQHILLPGVVASQVQDFALSFVQLHEVPVSSFLQPVGIHLVYQTLLPICVISKLARVVNGLSLDFVPLISTHWAHLFSLFSDSYGTIKG